LETMPSVQQATGFSRMEEYKAILENVGQQGARRQNVTNLYIGLNTLFLTGLGLTVPSHFGSWWTVLLVGAFSVVVLPLNLTWRTSLRRYETGLTTRYDYLREIEREFQRQRSETTGGASDGSSIGLFLRLQQIGLLRAGSPPTREGRLALYFVLLYPFLTIVLAILTYLTNSHLIMLS